MLGIRNAARSLRDSPHVNDLATRIARAVARSAAGLAASSEMHGIRGGNIAVELPGGAHVTFVGGDALTSRLWWHGWRGYEPASLELWMRLAARADSVVDVGANVGFFALTAAAVSPNARVVAIEPGPEPLRRLRANLAVNGFGNVAIVEAAVCESNGSRTLWTPPDALGASLVPGGPETTVGTVRGVTFDQLVREQGLASVDLVKIDVERAEPFVLQGMSHTLSTHSPDVLIEVLDQPTADAVNSAASTFGYRTHLVTDAGPVETASCEPHGAYLNHWLTAR